MFEWVDIRSYADIFYNITNTPCLVFQNNNHKVRETYDWIKENKNINLVETFSELEILDFLKQDNFDIGCIPNLIKDYYPISGILNKS